MKNTGLAQVNFDAFVNGTDAPAPVEETKRITVDVSKRMHLAFKRACLDRGVTITEAITEAIEKFVAETE